MSLRLLYLSCLIVTVAGCSAEGARKIPGVYRIDIQQGNVIEQEMLNSLKPGMAKEQVHFIMGTPTIVDPFHNDRWEYLYTFSEGGKRRQQRHITIYFDDDNKLAYLDGGVVKGIRKPPEDYRKERKTVEVPDRRKKGGFFSKLVNVIPFVGDDEPKRQKVYEDEEKDLEDEAVNDVTADENEAAESPPP